MPTNPQKPVVILNDDFVGKISDGQHWTHHNGLTPRLRPPKNQRPDPRVTISDTDRWAQTNTLLHEENIHLNVRIAGLFILLYGQPLTRVLRMRAQQILTPGHPTENRPTTAAQVSVVFDTVPIQLPTPLDAMVLTHLNSRGFASYVSQPTTWLFPGGVPGRHLASETVRRRLTTHGIHPSTGRGAAMFQLAGAVPVPVLAELLGLSTHTASRWSALANSDWSPYLALRNEHRPPNSHPPRNTHP